MNAPREEDAEDERTAALDRGAATTEECLVVATAFTMAAMTPAPIPISVKFREELSS